MKKIISIIFLLCVCFGVFSSCAKEEKSMDSLNLPEQVYSDLQMPEDTFILKFSDRRITVLCDEAFDIKDDFDKSKYMEGGYYSLLPIENAVGIFNQYDENGNIVHLTIYSQEKFYDDFFEYAKYPEKVLGYSARVENIYCYANVWSYWECWIYYETEDGTDFVLLKEYDIDEELYLFPVEELKPIAKALDEHEKRNAQGDGISVVSDVAYISAYEIIPRDMTRAELVNTIWLSASACLMISVIIVSIIIIIKKNKIRKS